MPTITRWCDIFVSRNIPERPDQMDFLTALEHESIRIIREAVAEAERPVMLYSIGKDFSVMLHLALKAFWPLKPPFPLMHVDTTWKFREMITFGKPWWPGRDWN